MKSPTIAVTIELASPPKAPAASRASEQQVVARGEAAGERGQSEAGVEDEQGALAVELVEKEAAGKSAHGGGDAVARDQLGKLRRADPERRHELRAQRHHDHEIKDVRELHRPEHEERGALAARGEMMVLFNRGHKR